MGSLKTSFRLPLSIWCTAPVSYSKRVCVRLQFRTARLVWLYSKVVIGGVRTSAAYDAVQCLFHNVGLTNFNEICTTRIKLKFWGVGLKSLRASVGACSPSTLPAIGQPCWHPGLIGLKQRLRILKAASARPSMFRPLPQSNAPSST